MLRTETIATLASELSTRREVREALYDIQDLYDKRSCR